MFYNCSLMSDFNGVLIKTLSDIVQLLLAECKIIINDRVGKVEMLYCIYIYKFITAWYLFYLKQ